MKISIELDTLHDDKGLIAQVLNILTQRQHKCNCHHHDTPVVNKEEPTPASPEPKEPKKRRSPPKKGQIPRKVRSQRHANVWSVTPNTSTAMMGSGLTSSAARSVGTSTTTTGRLRSAG